MGEIIANNRKGRETNRLPRLDRVVVAAYAVIFVAAPILTYFIGRFLDRTFVLPAFPPFPVNLPAGLGVLLFGLTIGIKSTRLLYLKGRGLPWGEVNQKAQSTRLVSTSLYACCRHPMTFGYSLLPCGMGILFRSLTMTFLITAITFLVMISWLKLREEPRLERRFGQAYREYKRQTPFLIPRFTPLVRILVSSGLGLLRKQKRVFARGKRLNHAYPRCSAHTSVEKGKRQKTKKADPL